MMCRLLGGARAGHYGGLDHRMSDRSLEDASAASHPCVTHGQSRDTGVLDMGGPAETAASTGLIDS